MDVIDQFISRYRREFDFYDQAGRLVAQQLDNRRQASGVRAIVTSRAKNPKRLAVKVRQRNIERHYSKVEDIYEDIVDLAGVRVALYFPGERTEVDKIIRDLFSLTTHPKIFTGTSNPSYQKRFSGYWATHYRVQLRDTALDETQQRYADARVEIQVASVLMHAWSEVEHDLVYKPIQGSLSEDELAILDELNGMVLTGEIALERLQKAVEARVTRRGASFNNHYELASFLFEAAKPLLSGTGDPVIGEVDVLFALLQKIGITTPEALEDYVRAIHPDTEHRPVAQQIIDQILATDPTRYSAFASVRAQSDQPSPFIGVDQGTNTDESQQALGYFISRWITFERFLRELGHLRNLDPRQVTIPTPRLLRELDIFDAPMLNEIDSIRRLRNDLMHGFVTKDNTYIREVGQILEHIMAELSKDHREDVRIAAERALNPTAPIQATIS